MSIQASLIVAQQAAQANLVATAATETAQYQLTYVVEEPDGTRSRFSLAGPASLAALVIGAAGCSSPHPDGLDRTTAQQGAPTVRSEYYQSQVAVMDRQREEGQHGDQALFGIGIGAALLFGLLVGFVLGRRSGRKSAAHPPPPVSHSSGPGFMRGVGE